MHAVRRNGSSAKANEVFKGGKREGSWQDWLEAEEEIFNEGGQCTMCKNLKVQVNTEPYRIRVIYWIYGIRST